MRRERVRRVFISYRRSDSGGHAGRLAADLAQLGPHAVFFDTKDIGAGADFKRDIEFELDRCAVILIVIGPDWVTASDAAGGTRRIDNPDDVLRREVAAALRAEGARVIPVLVGGATLPKTPDLPADVVKLLDLSAHEILARRWNEDCAELIAQFRPVYDEAKPVRSLQDLVAPAKSGLLWAAAMMGALVALRVAAPLYSVEKSIAFALVIITSLGVFFLGMSGRRLWPSRVLKRLTTAMSVALLAALATSTVAYGFLGPMTFDGGSPNPADACLAGYFNQAFGGSSRIFSQGPPLCDQRTWCETGSQGEYQQVRIDPVAVAAGATLTVSVGNEHVIDFIRAPAGNRTDIPDGVPNEPATTPVPDKPTPPPRPAAQQQHVLTFRDQPAEPFVVRFRVTGSSQRATVRAVLTSAYGIPVQEERREVIVSRRTADLSECNDAQPQGPGRDP